MKKPALSENGRVLEKRLLGELILVRRDYPRRYFSRAMTEEMARLIRQGVSWHTPMIVDRENHLVDGWRRFEGYRIVFPEDWPLLSVEVQVIDCPPEERLLMAAILNRIHGDRLDDEEAATVAAKYAILATPATPNELRAKAREYARMLSVDTRLVLDRLFPRPKEKASLRVSTRPPHPVRSGGVHGRKRGGALPVARGCSGRVWPGGAWGS